MNTGRSRTALELSSLVKANGELELSLVDVDVPAPAADEVVVRVEAAPVNPSDQGLMFAAADMRTAVQSGSAERPVVTARIPEARMKSLSGRVGRSMPVGNEGAGVVVDAGASHEARALLGRTVAVFGGPMYVQYRCVKAEACLVLPEGTTPAQGASCFVNPLTALGMVETLRREHHKALVHTAAASNLGRMLERLCASEGIGLVNVVRSAEQARLLRSTGAAHVCDSSAPTFAQDLTDAVLATGATLAFDAVGGGTLAAQILSAMEAALTRSASEYSRYGSTTHKQVYIYGMLDTGPTVIDRTFGFSWGVGGWLLWPFLQRIGPAAVARLRERIVAGLTTTFASHYAKEISLAEALRLDEIAAYGKRATGAKYLLNPNKDSADRPGAGVRRT